MNRPYDFIAAGEQPKAAELGDRPPLIRIDSRPGHGGGKAMDKALDEIADM